MIVKPPRFNVELPVFWLVFCVARRLHNLVMRSPRALNTNQNPAHLGIIIFGQSLSKLVGMSGMGLEVSKDYVDFLQT